MSLQSPAAATTTAVATEQKREQPPRAGVQGHRTTDSVCGAGGGSTGHDRASGVQQAASERPPPRQTVVVARDFLLATRLQSCKSQWLNKSFKAYDGQLNSAKAGRATKAASGGRAVSTTCKTSARASAGQVHHDGTDCFDNFDDASPTTFREKRRLKKAAQTQRAARQIVATAEARTADPEWAKMGKGKPKLTSEERSRRVAHKKLKLAARARFERTLQYANAATNTVVDANMGSSSLISFIMTPAPEENSVVLQPLKKSKLKVPAEASIFYLKRWLTNNLQGPDSEKLKVKDMQILCRELVLSNETTLFQIREYLWPKNCEHLPMLRYRLKCPPVATKEADKALVASLADAALDKALIIDKALVASGAGARQKERRYTPL